MQLKSLYVNPDQSRSWTAAIFMTLCYVRENGEIRSDLFFPDWIDPSPERQKDVWLFAVANPAKFIKKRVLKDESNV